MSGSSWRLLEGDGSWEEDRGLTHGLGVFETMLMVEGKVTALEAHLERMNQACERIGAMPPDRARVDQAVAQIADDHPVGRWRLRLMRTAGAGGLFQLAGSDGRTLVSVMECLEPPEQMRVATAPWARNETSPLAGIKSTSYAEGLIGMDRAKSKGVDELLFANTRGEWCEGTVSNLFAFSEGRLLTPPLESGCLPGVTRARVLALAARKGIPVEEVAMPMSRLREMDEVFLTSSTRGVVPVVELDGEPVSCGPVAAALRKALPSFA